MHRLVELQTAYEELDENSQRQSKMEAELRACSAACLCAVGIVGWEGIPKAAPEARAAVEACFTRTTGDMLGSIGKVLTAECCAEVIPRAAELLAAGRHPPQSQHNCYIGRLPY